jgi:hypothetical protein
MVRNIWASFKFIRKVGVEESIVNAARITDHGSAVFKYNLTFAFFLVLNENRRVQYKYGMETHEATSH